MAIRSTALVAQVDVHRLTEMDRDSPNESNFFRQKARWVRLHCCPYHIDLIWDSTLSTAFLFLDASQDRKQQPKTVFASRYTIHYFLMTVSFRDLESVGLHRRSFETTHLSPLRATADSRCSSYRRLSLSIGGSCASLLAAAVPLLTFSVFNERFSFCSALRARVHMPLQ